VPTQTITIIQAMISNIQVDPNLSPSEFIEKYWTKYKDNYPSNNNLNGKIFEELIAITLVRSQILPFYMQARVAFIPNIDYDFVIYSKGIGPIVLSAKTSLRERYKQADLEAVALKYVHRKSESYVISLDEKEIRRRKKNLDDVMAIDNFVNASLVEYDELLQNLQARSIIESPVISVVSSKIMINSENYKERWEF
jgi:hypothetical protein